MLFLATVIVGGYVTNGISKGTAKVDADIKISENGHSISTAKSSSQNKKDSKNKNQEKFPSIYYGADTYGGMWQIVTKPMDFIEAYAWIYYTGMTGVYGKNASWGIYTYNATDAAKMAIACGGTNLILDAGLPGIYPHYHLDNRTFMDKYKHFHFWYGTLGGT